jgi:hypothetical protein
MLSLVPVPQIFNISVPPHTLMQTHISRKFMPILGLNDCHYPSWSLRNPSMINGRLGEPAYDALDVAFAPFYCVWSDAGMGERGWI